MYKIEVKTNEIAGLALNGKREFKGKTRLITQLRKLNLTLPMGLLNIVGKENINTNEVLAAFISTFN